VSWLQSSPGSSLGQYGVYADPRRRACCAGYLEAASALRHVSCPVRLSVSSPCARSAGADRRRCSVDAGESLTAWAPDQARIPRSRGGLALALFGVGTAQHQRGSSGPRARGGEEHEGLQGEQGTTPAQSPLDLDPALIRAVSSNRTVACSTAILAAGRSTRGAGQEHWQRCSGFNPGGGEPGIRHKTPIAQCCRADDEAIDTGRLHTMGRTPHLSNFLRSSLTIKALLQTFLHGCSGFPRRNKDFRLKPFSVRKHFLIR